MRSIARSVLFLALKTISPLVANAASGTAANGVRTPQATLLGEPPAQFWQSGAPGTQRVDTFSMPLMIGGEGGCDVPGTVEPEGGVGV